MTTFTQHLWTTFAALGLRITGQVTQQLATCGVDNSTTSTALAG